MAISQKQIAERLGVSIALVSRVLSGQGKEIGLADNTIKRVQETAAEMGYVPSAAALSLKGKATRTIGVVVYDFKDPFFSAIIEQLQTEAHDHNYSLILVGFLNRNPDEQDLRALYKHALDGLIVLGTELKADWLKKFKKMPVARIGHGHSDEQSVRLSLDEEKSCQLLIKHLQQLGKTRPIYLSANLPAHQIRKYALETVAAASGMELQFAESSERRAFHAGKQLADNLPNNCDALICATDQIAIGALHALNERGTVVPDQIVVTGFDDIPSAAQFIPTITSVRQPITEMAKAAFAAVMDKTKPEKILFSGELITRKSSRAV
jgi:LacI family transcriptional regulator